MTPSPPASPDGRAGMPPDAQPDALPDALPDERPGDAPAADETLDLRGLMCPLPVLKARKALRRLGPGATLEVLATDPAAVIDFRHFCETTANELLGWRERAGTYAFRIRTPG